MSHMSAVSRSRAYLLPTDILVGATLHCFKKMFRVGRTAQQVEQLPSHGKVTGSISGSSRDCVEMSLSEQDTHPLIALDEEAGASHGSLHYQCVNVSGMNERRHCATLGIESAA